MIAHDYGEVDVFQLRNEIHRLQQQVKDAEQEVAELRAFKASVPKSAIEDLLFYADDRHERSEYPFGDVRSFLNANRPQKVA